MKSVEWPSGRLGLSSATLGSGSPATNLERPFSAGLKTLDVSTVVLHGAASSHSIEPQMSVPTAESKAQLSVVFSQNDRSRQGRALERLIGLFGSLRSAELQLIIVDNTAPGDWTHEISDSIVQLGGSSPFADLAAFDRGVTFLESVDRPVDFFLFITDRFLHSSEIEGPWIDEMTTTACLELETCIGWIDDFEAKFSHLGRSYSKVLSTRFLWIPKKWLPSFRPFDVFIESRDLLSAKPGLLLSDAAPLSPELREHVLASLAATGDEHETDEHGTVVSRQQRALGLLKEHLFSARVLEKEIPCDDVRLLKGHSAATVRARPSAWPWSSGGKASEGPKPRFHLESCEVPERFHHGEAAQLKLTGWVLSEPQARAVRIELSDRESVVQPCDIPRPDVLEAHADVYQAHRAEADELCGFKVESDLGFLRPGHYQVRWVVPGTSLSEDIGRFEVLRSQKPLTTVTPEVHLEYLDFRSHSLEPPEYIVGIAGWVRNHFVVEKLVLRIGEETAALALDELRQDVAEHLGETLVKKQGFHGDFFFKLAPGEYQAQIHVSWQGQREILWQDTVTLEAPAGPDVVVNCEQLSDLVEGRVSAFWSSINLEGTLSSRHVEFSAAPLSVALWVDSVEVDRQEVKSGELFDLRHTPDGPGCYPLRLTVRADERELYDSGPRLATFEDFQMPEEAVAALTRFIERFELEPMLEDAEPEDLARAALGSDRQLKGDYLEMLGEIGKALESTGRFGDEEAVELSPVWDTGVVESISFRRRAPLKVLFVSWEVPYPRHGGGVWLTKLLESLQDRHEITLVHSYGVDEEDWLEEVRGYAPRVISIPRLAKAKTQPADSRMLRHIYEDYLPTLHSAIEMEVETGNYDIVNYDYSKLYPHATSLDIPQIMIVHEERFSTSFARWSQEEASRPGGKSQMDSLLREFYFSALKMPRKFSHLAALTEEDAYMLKAFQSTSEVYVNHIGVDVDRLGRPAEMAESDSPTLVFLGNYRHPPNVAAAKFFAENVMPEVRKRNRQARFLIIGSHAPKELKACENEGVSVTGFVDDFRPYLWQAAAFVAPIFLGAGMRVKILEAMACGVPIIGTQRSMHGIEAVDGQQYLRAETASQFVEQACRCLESRTEASEIGRQGAALIAEKHSYEMSAREREMIWYRVIENWK